MSENTVVYQGTGRRKNVSPASVSSLAPEGDHQ